MVLAALGGSVAADELKGDYAAAEAAAVAGLDAARAGRDAHALAEAAIWASVVSVLRSEAGAAASRLEEALAAAPAQHLLDAARNFATTGSARMPDGAYADPVLGTEPGFWSEPPPKRERLAAELYALSTLPDSRLQIHSQLDAPRRRSALNAALKIGLDSLEPVWDQRPHARLAAADLCHRARAPKRAADQLAAAVAAYSAAGDAAGLAACELMRGAWAAVRTGSPVTLGLELWDEPVSGSFSRINRSERTVAAVPSVAASAEFYRRAEEGFRGADASRGVAMVALHRSAVAALHDTPGPALEAAERAQAAFDAAGDAAGAQLAAAHAALARIQAREWPERSDIAEALGAWGRGPGSPGWALGIGLLFAHAGWRWLRRDGDAERALACLRLAETTLAALGADDLAHQVLGDRAAAHAAAGELDAALAAADRALRALTGQRTRFPADLVLEQREEFAASAVRVFAQDTRDADRIELVRPTLERQQARLADAAGWIDVPLWVGDAAGRARQYLQWDAALAPTYRALAARRRNPREYRRQLAIALAAAADVRAGEGARLEATVLLACQDRAAGRAAVAAHPLPGPDLPDVEWLIDDARLVAALEDWPEARRRHAALDAVRRDWWDQADEPWTALGDVARTAEGLGELDTARARYRGALDRLEQRRGHVARRRRADLPPASALYGDAARAELTTDGAGALALAEHGRASRLLADMGRSAALAAATPKHAKALREWRELTARIEMLTWLAARGVADHAAALAAAEKKLEALEGKLAASDPRWLDAVNPAVATLGADEIRARLPEGALLIEHLLVRGALLSWAVTRDGPVEATLRQTDELALDELQRKLWIASQGQSTLWARFADQLGEALLAPFDAAIAACDHLIVVPHRWGQVAPLAALYWRGAPLVDARPVSVLPSASALGFVRESVPGPGAQLLAVGDPANMSRRRPGEGKPTGGFGALPWCGAQAAEAASLFGAAPLLGADASEAAVRTGIEGAAIVHFATHGVLDAGPLLSSIVLADGDTLDVWELVSLPLDADLVVYGACDSAGEPDALGDQIIGLAWLTLASGARAVVASLWKVSELSTALLMRAFYGALRDGKPPREALAEAQRHVRGLTWAGAQPELAALRATAVAAGRPEPADPVKPPVDFSHPYHWAGFVLIGV